MRFSAFRALRTPDSATAARYSCPPYDVLTREEALTIFNSSAGSNFVSVIRPDIYFPSADHGNARMYERAREELKIAENTGLLVREKEECVYLYGLRAGAGRSGAGIEVNGGWQWGIVGLVGAEEVGKSDGSGVLVHEMTREDKERDRTLLTRTTRAHTGPVFLCYRDDDSGKESRGQKVLEVVERLVKGESGNDGVCVAEFVDSKGVEHRVLSFQAIKDDSVGSTLVNVVKDLKVAYVADGHHRAASAVNVAKEIKEKEGEGGYFLAALFPASQLNILPYNRVVQDLNGMSVTEFLGQLRENVDSFTEMESRPGGPPQKPGSVYIYIDGKWYHADFGQQSLPLEKTARLDSSLLQARILEPLLGIDDPRRNDRISFVGGVHGLGFLEKKVDSGDAAVAFGLRAVDVNDLMEVADNGCYMPPKSTWFEPKLRSGLLVNTF